MLEKYSGDFYKKRDKAGWDKLFYDFNPIDEWEIYELFKKNATINKVARMLLSAPAGTAGVESTGSFIKKIKTPQTVHCQFGKNGDHSLVYQ